MGFIDVNGVSYSLADGRPLLDEVSFRVGEGTTAALIGANGAGKSTLLRIIRGAAGWPEEQGGLKADEGASASTAASASWTSSSGTLRDTVHRARPARLGRSAKRFGMPRHAVDRTELALIEHDTTVNQLAYATALAEYADAGGYDQETVWDTCTVAALGIPFERAKYREINTLSGGEQKRLVLEALLRGPEQVLLLDEPDNYLDVPGKRWLEDALRATQKTVLLVSHDRELLARAADRIITVEVQAAGNSTWTHGGGFATYHEARDDRMDRLDELRRRWDEQHAKLKTLVANLKVKATANDGFASRYQAALDAAAQVRGGRTAAGAPARPGPQDAPQGRAHGQPRRGVRAARAHGAHGAVRPRGLVRRARRRARVERVGQVALPASARARGHDPGEGAPHVRR